MVMDRGVSNRFSVVELKDDKRAFLVELATEQLTDEDWEQIQRHVVLARERLIHYPLFYAFSLARIDHVNPKFVRGLLMMWRFIGMNIGVHACLCDCSDSMLSAMHLYKVHVVYNIYRTRKDAMRHLGLKGSV